MRELTLSTLQQGFERAWCPESRIIGNFPNSAPGGPSPYPNRNTEIPNGVIANFHWHDLRHTFASRLVMAGVDIRTVQEWMGHKTIQVTMRFAHLAPQHQLEAVQRLCSTGSALSKATDPRTDTTATEAISPVSLRPN